MTVAVMHGMALDARNGGGVGEGGGGGNAPGCS